MALTAQELVVIGRGKLISQCSTEEFVAQATENTITVRSPQIALLRSALSQQGVTVRDEKESLVVSGMEMAEIGELAAAKGVVLHELSQQRGSLEEAFIQLTGDSVEYHAMGVDADAIAEAQTTGSTDLQPAGK
jgi:ABC-2 type transport system ATP-binding protein